ncbi:MAG: MotA/TolQ/ExbB proton channel family protein [Pirellulaceae bacterium]
MKPLIVVHAVPLRNPHPPRSRGSHTPARRVGIWFVGIAMLLGGWQLASAVPLWAQEDVPETELLDEVVPAADELGRDTATPRSDEQTRTLLDTLKDGGIIGLFIGILSVIGLGFAIEHGITIRKSALMPDTIAADLETMIQEGRVDEASEYCGAPENESLIADVVLAGLQRFRSSEFGFAEYKAAVEEAGEDQTGRLYRKTEVLGVVGTIAPMLGLLGTVLGMIEAFNMIASTGGAARPDELAGGISKALVTTMMGLSVAIPAMLAFSYFRNKIDSIVAETGKRVEQILMPLGRRR